MIRPPSSSRSPIRHALITYVPTLSLFGTAMLILSCAAATHPAHILEDDLIVIGQIVNGDNEVLDDFGLNVAITARVTIKRVIRGRAPAPVLTVRYIAHNNLLEDRDYRFHLHRTSGDRWLVCVPQGRRGYQC